MTRPGELSAAAARRLAVRRPLAVDARRGPAVKRNLHEVVVGAEAPRFARAFADVLAEPGADFAGLRLLRVPGRAGRPFVPGERFQAAFRLPAAVPFAARLEERFTSDYAEIVDLDEGDDRFVARYRYLEGAPLAGSSTLAIAAAGPGRARLTVVFELQEVGALGVEILHRFGIQAHDRAIVAQARAAAARLGAPLLACTVRVSGKTDTCARDAGPWPPPAT